MYFTGLSLTSLEANTITALKGSMMIVVIKVFCCVYIFLMTIIAEDTVRVWTHYVSPLWRR